MTDTDTQDQLAELHAHDTATREAFAAFQQAFTARNRVGRLAFSLVPPNGMEFDVRQLALLVSKLPSGAALDQQAATTSRNARLNREAEDRAAAEKKAIKERDAAASSQWVAEFNLKEQRAYAVREWEKAKALAELKGEPQPPMPDVLKTPERPGAAKKTTAGFR